VENLSSENSHKAQNIISHLTYISCKHDPASCKGEGSWVVQIVQSHLLSGIKLCLNSASGSHPKIQSDMENYRTISETQSLLLTFRITQKYLKIDLFFSHWELNNIQKSISFDIEKYATSKNLFWHWELHNMCPRVTINTNIDMFECFKCYPPSHNILNSIYSDLKCYIILTKTICCWRFH